MLHRSIEPYALPLLLLLVGVILLSGLAQMAGKTVAAYFSAAAWDAFWESL